MKPDIESNSPVGDKLPHFAPGKHAREGREREHESYGPFGFLNPTGRRSVFSFDGGLQNHDREGGVTSGESVGGGKENGKQEEREKEDGMHRVYRTRDNRKGRHAITLTPTLDANPQYHTPPASSSLRSILRGVLRMIICYPIWDISYLVAVIFTLGSVVWVINSFFVWLPLQDPSTEFNGEITDAGGISAFIGATIFEIGSVLLMLEAVNEERESCFGWAVEEVIEGEEKRWRVREEKEGCRHHHGNKWNLVGKSTTHVNDEKENNVQQPMDRDARKWTWWPTWYELRTHYFKELGFLACSSQMLGATIFWISGFTALPPIYDRLTSTAAQNGAYWLPQVIGGTGFIVSGTLFTLETQTKWYLPAWKVLGWHIGAWNLVGGIGFTLCGALGFAAANSGAVYQGSLATFWGSWCFLVGSVIQWYESLDKHPVDVSARGGRTPY